MNIMLALALILTSNISLAATKRCGGAMASNALSVLNSKWELTKDLIDKNTDPLQFLDQTILAITGGKHGGTVTISRDTDGAILLTSKNLSMKFTSKTRLAVPTVRMYRGKSSSASKAPDFFVEESGNGHLIYKQLRDADTAQITVIRDNISGTDGSGYGFSESSELSIGINASGAIVSIYGTSVKTSRDNSWNERNLELNLRE
jgi:hypothetical protein